MDFSQTSSIRHEEFPMQIRPIGCAAGVLLLSSITACRSSHDGRPAVSHVAQQRSAVAADDSDARAGVGESFKDPAAYPLEAMEFYLRQRVPRGDNKIPFDRFASALEETQRREREVASGAIASVGGTATWESVGPSNIGGRTRALVIDPTSPQTMYAAGVAGGVFKTLDGGASWTPLDDFLPNLAISALAMDPANSQALYAGTGEGYFNSSAVRGNGIYKTTDGGASWTLLSATVTNPFPEAFHYVNDIAVSPNDSDRAYACTRVGIYRTLDGGASWQVVLRNAAYFVGPPLTNGSFVGCTDIELRQDSNPDVIFAAFGSFIPDGLFRSQDGGDTWAQVGTGTDVAQPGQGRMSIAVAPSNNDTIYVSMASNGLPPPTGTSLGVFRSLDGGSTWSERTDAGYFTTPLLLSNLFLGGGCAGTNNRAQGWYDNIIAVDPVDPARVWVGGVDLFRSDDGGQTFDIAGYSWFDILDPNFIHPDHHIIRFHPDYDGVTNQTMFVGNDGGVYVTENAAAATSTEECPPGDPLPAITWEPRNDGYAVTQFYHGDVSSIDGRVAAGAQDWGTNLRPAGGTNADWGLILGGDGGYFAFDPVEPDVMYATTQRFPSIYKSIDGAASFDEAVTGITDSDGLFISPFALDPNDPSNLWTGGSRIWRSQDGAANWEMVTPDFPNVLTASAFDVADGNSDLVYVGWSNGFVTKIENATAPAPEWITFSIGNGLTLSAFISSVKIDPTNHRVVYVTYSTYGVPHVLRSTDSGETWTAIDGEPGTGIPDIPVHWLEVRPCAPKHLYVGTEVGVYRSIDDGETWQPYNAGLANTRVESLKFDGPSDLYAFTHGRGVFRELFGVCDCNGNFIDDALDLGGGAEDCNLNAIPDECERFLDCNENGTLDECDILSGGSLDDDDSGIPDECEVPTTLFVDEATCVAPGSGTSSDPFCFLDDAVAASRPGGTILVRPGTYTGIGNRLVTIEEDAVSIRCTDPLACVIDMQDIEGPAFGIFGTFTDPVLLEGFTIRRGLGVNGGGLYVGASGPVTVRNIVIEDCHATNRGGGMYLGAQGDGVLIENVTVRNNEAPAGGGISADATQAYMQNCQIIGNRATEGTFGGGGIWLARSNSAAPPHLRIAYTEIRDNEAIDGGGLYFSGGANARFHGCFVSGNTASREGGGAFMFGNARPYFNACEFSRNTAIGDGGALFVTDCSPIIFNGTIVENQGARGGGIFAIDGSSALIRNGIVWGNTADSGGPQGAVSGDGGVSSLAFFNTNLQGGEPDVLVLPGGEVLLREIILDADPLFVDAPGGNFRIDGNSPCADAGANGDVMPDLFDLDGDGDELERTPRDGDGGPRYGAAPAPDTGDGSAPYVDMGAYEWSDCNGNSIDDGSEVFAGSEEDCDLDGLLDSCALGSGAADDCDSNGRIDSCELSEGTVFDCDANGISDVCDVVDGRGLDCNRNGQLDSCDITVDATLDENADGLIDACEALSRYLLFEPREMVAASPVPHALRVEVRELDGYPELSGLVRWLQAPEEFDDVNPGGDTFLASQLGCEPVFLDWSTIDRVYAYGTEVLPESGYELSAVASGCLDLADPLCRVANQTRDTSVWGDTVWPYAGGALPQPDIGDILSLIDKLLGRAFPEKPRSQMIGAIVDPTRRVDILDVLACVDSFLGRSFPDANPTGCTGDS